MAKLVVFLVTALLVVSFTDALWWWHKPRHGRYLRVDQHGTKAMYKGCYKDHAGRELSGSKITTDHGMTQRRCILFCKRHHYRFAGLEYAYQCFCGNHLPATKTKRADCNMRCKGNSHAECGGGWRLSVFKIKKRHC